VGVVGARQVQGEVVLLLMEVLVVAKEAMPADQVRAEAVEAWEAVVHLQLQNQP
jgi:hypothetical protein